MKTKILTFSLASIFLLSSCAASRNYTDAPPSLGGLYSKYVYIGYEGPLLDFSEVGIITTDGLLKIKSVDNKPITSLRTYKDSGFYTGGRFQLHLQPGVYSLGLAFHDDRGGGVVSRSTSDITETISIAKGQVIHLGGIAQGRTWRAYTSDGSNALATIRSDFKALTTK